MVRWRICLLLTVLLVISWSSAGKCDDDDDEEIIGKRGENDDEDEKDDEDEEEEEVEKESASPGRRILATRPYHSSTRAPSISRTTKRSPLECYVCAYKSETPLRACLEPSKYRVNTVTCHNVDDRCFTSVMTKGNTYDAVVRGCRSGCLPTQDTVCCDLNRCNNQAFSIPVMQPRVSVTSSRTTKTMAPSVLFFVTILLILQTVAKVAYF